MSSNNLSGFNEFAGNTANPPTARAPHSSQSLEKYRKELRDMELTEDQETEILQILWTIMSHFARLGQTVDVCGLFFEDGTPSSDEVPEQGRIGLSTDKETPSRNGKEAK